jgi:hypothetical protein
MKSEKVLKRIIDEVNATLTLAEQIVRFSFLKLMNYHGAARRTAMLRAPMLIL